MVTLTEDQYALEQAGPMPHATFTRSTANMSGAALRRAQKQHAANLLAWEQRMTAARAEYQEQVASGQRQPPTRIEQLKARARGHPDKASTQAARRVLEKQGISWTD